MCDTIVAWGDVTADGVTVFGKDSDREPNEAHHLLRVSAPPPRRCGSPPGAVPPGSADKSIITEHSNAPRQTHPLAGAGEADRELGSAQYAFVEVGGEATGEWRPDSGAVRGAGHFARGRTTPRRPAGAKREIPVRQVAVSAPPGARLAGRASPRRPTSQRSVRCFVWRGSKRS